MGAISGASYPKADVAGLLAGAGALRRAAGFVNDRALAVQRAVAGAGVAMPGAGAMMASTLVSVGSSARDGARSLDEGATALEEQAREVDRAQLMMGFTAAVTLWTVAQLVWAVAATGGASAAAVPAVMAGGRRSVSEIVAELLAAMRSGALFGVGQDALVQIVEIAKYREGLDVTSLLVSGVGGLAGGIGDVAGRGLGDHLVGSDLLRKAAGGALGGVIGGEAGTVISTAWQGGEWDPAAFALAAAAGAGTGAIGGATHHYQARHATTPQATPETAAPHTENTPQPAHTEKLPGQAQDRDRERAGDHRAPGEAAAEPVSVSASSSVAVSEAGRGPLSPHGTTAPTAPAPAEHHAAFAAEPTAQHPITPAPTHQPAPPAPTRSDTDTTTPRHFADRPTTQPDTTRHTTREAGATTAGTAGDEAPHPSPPTGHNPSYGHNDWRSREPNWPAAVAKAQEHPLVREVQALDPTDLRAWWKTLPETHRQHLLVELNTVLAPADHPAPAARTPEDAELVALRAAFAGELALHRLTDHHTTTNELLTRQRSHPARHPATTDNTARETLLHAAGLQATAADRRAGHLPAGAPTPRGGRGTTPLPGRGGGEGSSSRPTTTGAGTAGGTARTGPGAVRSPERTRTGRPAPATTGTGSEARKTATSPMPPARNRTAGPHPRTDEHPATATTAENIPITGAPIAGPPAETAARVVTDAHHVVADTARTARPGPGADEREHAGAPGPSEDWGPGVKSGARVKIVPPDPVIVRRVDDLHRALSRPSVNGAQVLVLLHHLTSDPGQFPAVDARFRERTGGRSVTDELTRAHEEGRLDDGSHLIAREIGRSDPAEPRDLRPRERVMAVHEALQAGDWKGLNTLLRGLRRRVPEVFDLEDGYSDRYPSRLRDDLREAFGEHAAYFAYLLGHEPDLEAMVLTPAEAQHWHEQAARLTFTDDTGETLPIPFDYPDTGCYGRAHAIAKMLHAAGVHSRKVFAVRDTRHPSGLVVESENAKGAMPGAPEQVNWWYHVAAVVLVDDGAGGHIETVIDPSLGHEAMPLRAWLAKMGVHSHARIAGFEATPHEFLEDPHAYLRQAAPRWGDTIDSEYHTLPDWNRPLAYRGYPDDIPMVFTTDRNNMNEILPGEQVPPGEEPSSLRYPEKVWKRTVKGRISGFVAEARYRAALREVRAMLQHPDTTADRLRRHLDTSPFGSPIQKDDLVSLSLRHRLAAPAEPPVNTTLRHIGRAPVPGLPPGPPPAPHSGFPHPEPFIFPGGAAAINAATAALWKPALDDLPVHENLRTVLVPHLGGDGTPHSSTGPLNTDDFTDLARAAGWQPGQALRVVFAALHPDATTGYDHPAYTAYLRHAAHTLDHDHPHPNGVDIHTAGALAPDLTLTPAKHTGAQAREKDFTAQGTDHYWGEWVRISTRPHRTPRFISGGGQLHPATADHPALERQKALDAHTHPFTAAPGHPHPADGIVISYTGTDARPPVLAPKPGLFTVIPRNFGPFGHPNTTDHAGKPFAAGPGLVARALYKRGYHGQDLLWQAPYAPEHRATALRYLLDLATELGNPDIYLPAPGSTGYTANNGHLQNRDHGFPADYERLTTTPDTPARHTTTDGSLQPRPVTSDTPHHPAQTHTPHTGNPTPDPAQTALTSVHKTVLDKARNATPAELEASWNKRSPELMRAVRNNFTELTGTEVHTPTDAEALHRYAFLRREAMAKRVEDDLPLLWQELNRKGGVDDAHGASADSAPSTNPGPAPGAASAARGDDSSPTPTGEPPAIRDVPMSEATATHGNAEANGLTRPAQTALASDHKTVLDKTRTISPAELEASWNKRTPELRRTARNRFTELTGTEVRTPADAEALNRYAFLRRKAMAEGMEDDLALLRRELNRKGGVDGTHGASADSAPSTNPDPGPASGAVSVARGDDGTAAPKADASRTATDPTPTALTPAHKAVLETARTASPATLESCWNAVGPTFRDIIREKFEKLAENPTSRPTDTEALRRYAYLRFRAFKAELQDDVPLLWQHLTHGSGAETIHDMPTGEGQRMDMKVDSPSPAAGDVTGVEAPAAHSTPETIDPTRSDTPPLTDPTPGVLTPAHKAVLKEALGATHAVRETWWQAESRPIKDAIERELATRAEGDSPRSADTEDGLRAAHLYWLACLEDLEDSYPALWRELKRGIDAENTHTHDTPADTGRPLDMNMDSPPTTTATTHDDHAGTQPAGQRLESSDVTGADPSIGTATPAVAHLTPHAADTRTDIGTTPPSTPGTTPAPDAPAPGAPVQRVATDPWPEALREKARGFLRRRDLAATLPGDQLALAERTLDAVTGREFSATAHTFGSPALIRTYRQKTAAFLRRHAPHVDLRTYNPADPLPLPGPEARLLSIHAARTPGGRPLPDAVTQAVTRTVLHYQRGTLRHEPPTPATVSPTAAPNTVPAPRSRAAARPPAPGPGHRAATTAATSRKPAARTTADRAPRHTNTQPATSAGTSRALRLPTVTLPATPGDRPPANARPTRTARPGTAKPATPTSPGNRPATLIATPPTQPRTAPPTGPKPATRTAPPDTTRPPRAAAAPDSHPTTNTQTPAPNTQPPGSAAARFDHHLTTRLTQAAKTLTTHPTPHRPHDPLTQLRRHVSTTPITDDHLHALAHTLITISRRITPDNLRTLHALTPLLTPEPTTTPTPHTLTTNLRTLTTLVLDTTHPDTTDIHHLLDITTVLNEMDDLSDEHQPLDLDRLRREARGATP
ncbi:protein-glutamine glutaminase family protein [Kitasatospora sp. NPDC093102]|uniref:protein-glutamine glutaminase family protein n=1 Tax=Kitasatospora sp. NPDC093102 TaxID=3155069 RepID=UPI003444A97C